MDKKKSFFRFFCDVGVIAWMCLTFGLIMFLITDFTIHPLHIIFAFIALMYSISRMHQVVDKWEIINEIRINNDKENKEAKHKTGK